MEPLKPWVKWAIAGLVVLGIVTTIYAAMRPTPQQQRQRELREDGQRKLEEFNRLREQRENAE